jgi:acyl carrier protein
MTGKHPEFARAAAGIQPLWSGELELWSAAALSPSGAYDIDQLFRLPLPLTRHAFNAAIRSLGNRHPLLRARYRPTASGVERHIAASTLEAQCVQLQPESVADDDAIATGWQAVDPRLDLEHGPVTAVVGFASPNGLVHAVGVRVHHLIVDRDSLRILEQDLGAVVERAARGSSLVGLDDATAADYSAFSHAMSSHAAATDSVDHQAPTATTAAGWVSSIAALQGTTRAEASLQVDPIARHRLPSGRRMLPLTPWLAAAYLTVASASPSLTLPFAMPLSLRGEEFAHTVGYFLTVVPLLITAEPGWGVPDLLEHVDGVLMTCAAQGVRPMPRGASQAGKLPAAFFEYLGSMSTPGRLAGAGNMQRLPAARSKSARYPMEFRLAAAADATRVQLSVAESPLAASFAPVMAEVFREALDLVRQGGVCGESSTVGGFLSSHTSLYDPFHPAPDVGSVASGVASDPAHAWLMAVVRAGWSEALSMQLGSDDDFFALGGDSLAALILAQALGDELGVELPLTFAFDHPRLSAQVAVLAGLLSSRGAPKEDSHHAT